MNPEWNDRLPSLAGVLTCLAVGVPKVLQVAGDPALLLTARGGGWLLAWAAFSGLFALISSGRSDPWEAPFPAAPRWALVGTVALATLTIGLDLDYSFTGALFVMTAAHAAQVLSAAGSLALILAQSALTAGAMRLSGANLLTTVVIGAAYLGLQSFALFTMRYALAEARAREELARANAELRATQALLAESSRLAERLRIARELHDTVGHHLTALSLNLEAAAHLTSGDGQAQVRRAQDTAKNLLADVRRSVSTLRDDRVDLRAALGGIVQAVSAPTIHLQLPDTLHLEDVNRAHALVCVVQEAVTNAARHARARNVWIELEEEGGEVRVEVRDDGRGAAQLTPGHGLTGMRERLEAFGGRLSLHAAPGQGLRLSARLPTRPTGAGGAA